MDPNEQFQNEISFQKSDRSHDDNMNIQEEAKLNLFKIENENIKVSVQDDVTTYIRHSCKVSPRTAKNSEISMDLRVKLVKDKV